MCNTEFATSSGAIKPSLFCRRLISSGDNKSDMTLPGWIEDTAMLCGLPSSAKLRERPCTAYLEVVYGTDIGRGDIDDIDATLMIRPPLPWVCMWRKASREHRNGPSTFTFITAEKVSALISVTVPPMAIPALFIKMSHFP